MVLGARTLAQLLPHDRVGGLARSGGNGAVGLPGEQRVRLLDGDGTPFGHAEVDEQVDDGGRRLAREVRENEVAGRVDRGLAQQDDVGDRLVAPQEGDGPVRQVARAHDPEVHHGPNLRPRQLPRAVGRSAQRWASRQATHSEARVRS